MVVSLLGFSNNNYPLMSLSPAMFHRYQSNPGYRSPISGLNPCPCFFVIIMNQHLPSASRYKEVRFKDDTKRCFGCNQLILADSYQVHAMFCEQLQNRGGRYMRHHNQYTKNQ